MDVTANGEDAVQKQKEPAEPAQNKPNGLKKNITKYEYI
jgi:hypothetical protein